jgi:hypothetical protein
MAPSTLGGWVAPDSTEPVSDDLRLTRAEVRPLSGFTPIGAFVIVERASICVTGEPGREARVHRVLPGAQRQAVRSDRSNDSR